MEGKNSKQKGSYSSSSSSSIATDLFGPKTNPSSSTSVFGSVFGPPPTGRPIASSHQAVNFNNKDYQQEATHPCHYSSSIYYGGQDVYSTPGHSTESHQQNQYKKDGQDDGSDGGASRGNWWEGSLYY